MKVHVISKLNFEGVLKVMPPEENPQTFYISITNPEGDEIFMGDRENYKNISFWDVEEDTERLPAVTEEQIQELYDFITSQKDKEMCVVHCSAGISRSGAVGTFINDYFGEDYKEFRKRHTRIHPNGRVKRLLNRLWRKDM